MIAKFNPSILGGTIDAPPSKSMAHRYLIGAAVSGQRATLYGVDMSEDILASMDCLTALGADITVDKDKFSEDMIKDINGKNVKLDELGNGKYSFYTEITYGDGTHVAQFSGSITVNGTTTNVPSTPSTKPSVPSTPDDNKEFVNIPDKNLRRILNLGYLHQREDAQITKGQLRSLTGGLDLEYSNITDLTGIQECIGITYLYLGNNKITDLTPLKYLKKLTYLDAIEQNIQER